jgi:hypothetical protein
MFAVLITAGLQEPVMPLFEETGKAGGAEFWHKVPMVVNTGLIPVAMVTSMLTADPHWPAPGVKL